MARLSRVGRPEGRQPAGASRDFAGGSYPGIRPITDRHLLLPSSHSRYPVGATYVSLSCPSGVWGQENNGVNSLRDAIRRGRVVPLGRWRNIRGGETLKSPHLATHLLVTACQQLMDPFWRFEPHGLYSALHLAINPSRHCAVPNRLAAGSRRVGSRLLDPRRCLGGYRCPSGFPPSRYQERRPR